MALAEIPGGIETIVYGTHDKATELLNRHGFEQTCNTWIEWASGNPQRSFCLLYGDLNALKDINDSPQFQHKGGDIYLQVAAGILSQHMGKRAILARIGGDEFAILRVLNSEEDDEDGTSPQVHFDNTIDQLRTAIATSIHIPLSSALQCSIAWLETIQVGITIGGALWEPGMDVNALLQQADASMQAKKATGKNQRITDLPPPEAAMWKAGEQYRIMADFLQRLALNGQDPSRFKAGR